MWRKSYGKQAGLAALTIGWVVASFLMAYGVTMVLLEWFGAYAAQTNMTVNLAVVQTVSALITYSVMLGLLIGVPWAIWNKKTTWRELGLVGLPTWTDIMLPLAGYIVYFFIAWTLSWLAGTVPEFDVNQQQNVGFTSLAGPLAYALAFLSLVVLAPIVEEIIFRGYLFAKLRLLRLPVWLVILIVSILFGLAHGQWNVAINVFALSIVLCSLRLITGTLWASILLHALKNSIAFYLLFINTNILTTIGS